MQYGTHRPFGLRNDFCLGLCMNKVFQGTRVPDDLRRIVSIHVSLFGDTFTAGYRPALSLSGFSYPLESVPRRPERFTRALPWLVFVMSRGSDICAPDRDMCFPGYQYVYISVDAGPGIHLDDCSLF
jgi:hypothetical protein